MSKKEDEAHDSKRKRLADTVAKLFADIGQQPSPEAIADLVEVLLPSAKP